MSPPRALLGPGIAAALAFLLLIGLGVWQVERLAWKRGILDQIARAEAGAPVPLTGTPRPYTKVQAIGRFRPDLAALYGAQVEDTPAGPQMGGQLIVPLDRPGQDPVLVDRGWVPDPLPASLPWPEGTVRVDGYAAPAQKPGMFTPAADKPARRFYALDPQVIGAALGLTHLPPFTLVALGPAVSGRYPIPAQTLPRPPNNHLGYALTWFGLAGALVVMFASWARSVLKHDRK